MVEREAARHFAATVNKATLQALIDQHQTILHRALAGPPDASLERDAQAVDWGRRCPHT